MEEVVSDTEDTDDKGSVECNKEKEEEEVRSHSVFEEGGEDKRKSGHWTCPINDDTCVKSDDELISTLMSDDETNSIGTNVKNANNANAKHHEYRIDFSDFVESTLQAVPEETDIRPTESPRIVKESPELRKKCTTLMEKPGVDLDTPILSEPLSARQQVALWLSRQSASNLSQIDLVSHMSSLKSLIFPSSNQRSINQSMNPQQSLLPTYCDQGGLLSRELCAVQPSTAASIARNYSTRSLLVSGPYTTTKHHVVKSAGHRDLFASQQTLNGMRKCETFLAIHGNRRDSAGYCTEGPSRDRRRATSSLSIFQRAIQWRGNRQRRTSTYRQPRTGESPLKPLRPINRFRDSTSSVCGHCVNTNTLNEFDSSSRFTSRATSQQSILVSAIRLNEDNNNEEDINDDEHNESFGCRICLSEALPLREAHRIQVCGCVFCKDCVYQYLYLEIMESAYAIACPNPECERQGVFQLDEIEDCVGKDLMDKHRTFRLNTEVSLDKTRTWCPEPNCNTVCHISTSSNTNKDSNEIGVAVWCPTCKRSFCSKCSAPWHGGKSCLQNGQELMRSKQKVEMSIMMKELEAFNNNIDIKQCPMCYVPIERDAGCAQMMCKRCKHVFCWYCLTSLDDDFLLRHYDSGECKGRLGHSRLSVLWHRAQVVAIFAGFGILILLAAPLLLVAAPCILCCKCKIIERIEAAAVAESEDKDDNDKNDEIGDDDDNDQIRRLSNEESPS